MTPTIDPTDGLARGVGDPAVPAAVRRGVDRLDLELVRSCYHPDATDAHGSFTGTVDEFLVWVERLLRRYDLTMHFLGTPLVEFDDATHAASRRTGWRSTVPPAGRRSRTSSPAFASSTASSGATVGGGSPQRVAVTEWSRIDHEDAWWPIPDGMLRGRRDRTDPVYEP